MQRKKKVSDGLVATAGREATVCQSRAERRICMQPFFCGGGYVEYNRLYAGQSEGAGKPGRGLK